MTKLILFLSIALVTLMVNLGFAQTDLTKPVPIDPELRTGVLDNGLTYYIRHNEEPKERASFYIIQNVGALLENDDQNGLAHFLEHMAFNGTEHFAGKGILNTLEKHGVAFGRNINAYTSFNETVYNLSDVPTAQEGLIDTCLLVLNDWSNYLLLTEEEIDAERGVITEEWRTRRNSGFRMRNQWFPVLFKGSKWAERDIIGDTTVIRYHDPETLRNFYHDWYRTDLQAIAIVGDVDVDAIEEKVKEMFSKIPAVENAKERTKFKIPHHNETYYVLATDKEASQSSVNVYILEENKDGEEKTLNDLRENYVRSLYNAMSGVRISELLQKGTPPFVNGSTRKGGFVRGYDVYSISTTANPNEEAKALEAIYIETERIKRHGFVESELERAKTNYMTQLESAYKQRDKIKNDRFAREYVGLYTSKEMVPGIEYEYEFAKEVMPTITAKEISDKAKEWIKKDNRTIVITGPSEEATHLTEKEAKNILAKVEAMDIEPYVDAASSSSLISEELKGSMVVKTKEIKDLDAVEWTLGNNVKVVYRHADYENDNVTLWARSDGGTSLWDNDYIASADMASTFVNTYGVGEFDNITLQKMLTGKKVSLTPMLSDLKEGLNGSSTPKDFETMMQLAYLYFEKPRFDEEAHNALMARYKAYVTNMAKDPRKIMQDTLSQIISNYNPRVKNLNPEFLDEVSFETIEKIYRDRIKDASDFTFFIVGNIEKETVKAMAEKYIGSLTDIDRKETWVDRKIEMPEGETEMVIPIKLTTPKATVNIRYAADVKYNMKNMMMTDILKAVLDLRFTETVREDEGGTYGVGIGASLSHLPKGEANMQIRFDCDPARADELKAIIYREINKVIEEGPTTVDFDKTIKNIQKDREQSREHNIFWMKAITNLYSIGINTADPKNIEEVLAKISQKDVQKFAKKFFANADHVDVVFVPKSE